MNPTVDVRERGKVPVPDAIVDAVNTDFWAGADCKVSRSAGDTGWTLTAGDSVGAARIVTANGDVTLRVLPKLETADPFFLADYAYEQQHDPLRFLAFDDVGLEAIRRDPTACLLVWHAKAIRKFASRWLRRDYRKIDRAFQGKVKGRILVSPYVSHHLSVGDAATVPCRVQERTQDTANNRLLKAGLRFIVSSSHTLAVPAARRVVMREARAALPLFAQVSDVPVSPQLLRAVSSRGPQRHYATVLAGTTSLLRGDLMGEDLARVPNTAAFMWRMPILFQEAVRGIIDSTAGFHLEPKPLGATKILDAAGQQKSRSNAKPDLVLTTGDGSKLVIDTKYKDALPSGNDPDEVLTVTADRHRVKVSRSDIYQVVAYRHHDKWPGSTGALLFPVVLAAGDQLPAPCRITGFGDPVWLVFVDIGRQAALNLPAFLATLASLSKGTLQTA